MDDIISTPEGSSATHLKSDMLKLEELLDDASFEQPISVSPSLIYPLQPGKFHGSSLRTGHEEKISDCNYSSTIPVVVEDEDQATSSLVKDSGLSNELQNTIDNKKSHSSLISARTRSQTPDLASTMSAIAAGLFSHSSVPVLSSNVVYPPKETCTDIPPSGTKSRVETQIKLSFELTTPLSISSTYSSTYVTISSSDQTTSSTCNSKSGSPASYFKTLPLSCETDQPPPPPTHDRVGSYKYLRLPVGTVTKRRSANPATAKKEAKVSDPNPEELLQMTAEVVCSSPPHMTVQSCESCQAREAKRTARKLASRVRPPPAAHKSKPVEGTTKRGGKKKGEEQFDPMEEDYEEPNVDDSILQFNCGETLNFSTGSVILPMRITCYCRHHKEKIGFNIVFTLTDHLGRVVGRGTTPPILITDDHKAANTVGKNLPMQHLLQSPGNNASPSPLPLNSSLPPEDQVLATSKEKSQPTSPKRRDPDTTKKRRPKPYDGRPVRKAGTLPNMEGRQGVVLALHPAHAKKQADGALLQGSLPGTRSPTPSEPTFIPISQSMNGARHEGGSSPPHPGTPSHDLSPRVMPLSATSTPALSQGQSGSSDSPLLSSFSPEYQPYFDAKLMYPSFAYAMEPPRIHRLIPSSGPTTGGIEVTVLGSNFHASLPLECVFGGVVASSTHRWSDNTLVCLLPPRATPGTVSVEIQGIPAELKQDGTPSLFHYVDESDRQLMELALQVVGLKMTGKIEEARNVAMRIVGNSGPPSSMGEITPMESSSEPFTSHSALRYLTGVDLETLIIKLLTLLDVPLSDEINAFQSSPTTLDHKNATGQTLLHLAVFLALPSLVSCLIGRGVDVNTRNNNGMTPLHFAALAGWKEGVEVLLIEGADPAIVDRMGLTPADRARGNSHGEIEHILKVSRFVTSLDDIESGIDGDDEAWPSEDEGEHDEERSQSSGRLYSMRSRTTSSTHLHGQLQDNSSESDVSHQSPRKDESPTDSIVDKSSKPDMKRDRSFVKRLQRTLPQNILPNVQIPGFSHIQLPDMPWGGLPQIPVFPIFVPLIPNLPWLNVPRAGASSGEKKDNLEEESGEKHQQHSLALLWAAYDSIANNSAWKHQWEKWSAYITAMQTANSNNSAENDLPPYSPRRPENEIVKKPEDNVDPTPSSSSQKEVDAPIQQTLNLAETKPVPTSSLLSIAKGARRLGYRSWKVSDSEVVAYYYKPKRQSNRQDRMLVLFWIPILIFGMAYALYTTLPVVAKTLTQGTRLISHKFLKP
ncbi:hypothetical protein Clacol_000435 [Clathrus columnatus]|uniref:IPT/TIG domain-containing protein n=1 Tax=Clathrus columnatus TaxID=1419009 RepID=A0AAV4ZZ22_9AGAM|nr:hypothetical protein Clacol_000435 [Clathrus columnatus]